MFRDNETPGGTQEFYAIYPSSQRFIYRNPRCVSSVVRRIHPHLLEA